MELATIVSARDPAAPLHDLRVDRLSEDAALIALASSTAPGAPGAPGPAANACAAALDRLRALEPRKWRKHKSWERLMRDLDEALRGPAPGAGSPATAAPSVIPAPVSLLIIALDGAHVFGASVGECAAWMLRRGFNHELTSHELLRAHLGAADDLAADRALASCAFESTLPGPTDDNARGGGALLLMTRGLWKHVEQSHLFDAALHMSPERAVARLDELARWRFNGTLAEDFAAAVIRRR